MSGVKNLCTITYGINLYNNLAMFLHVIRKFRSIHPGEAKYAVLLLKAFP